MTLISPSHVVFISLKISNNRIASNLQKKGKYSIDSHTSMNFTINIFDQFGTFVTIREYQYINMYSLYFIQILLVFFIIPSYDTSIGQG